MIRRRARLVAVDPGITAASGLPAVVLGNGLILTSWVRQRRGLGPARERLPRTAATGARPSACSIARSAAVVRCGRDVSGLGDGHDAGSRRGPPARAARRPGPDSLCGRRACRSDLGVGERRDHERRGLGRPGQHARRFVIERRVGVHRRPSSSSGSDPRRQAWMRATPARATAATSAADPAARSSSAPRRAVGRHHRSPARPGRLTALERRGGHAPISSERCRRGRAHPRSRSSASMLSRAARNAEGTLRAGGGDERIGHAGSVPSARPATGAARR